MQLLHSCGLPFPQFVSLSLLFEPSSALAPTADASTNDVSSNSNSSRNFATGLSMVDPMVIAAPCSSLSLSQSIDAVTELHVHLTNIIRACAYTSTVENSIATEFLREDERVLAGGAYGVQTFRPLGSGGVGLHYRLIRNVDNIYNNDSDDNRNVKSLKHDPFVSKLASFVLLSNKVTTTTSTPSVTVDPAIGLHGVVLCVAMTGISYSYGSNSVLYTLSQRMNDALAFLNHGIGSNSMSITDHVAAKALLYNYFILDDEGRKTNGMAAASSRLIVPEQSDVDDTSGLRNLLLSPMGIMSPIADIGRKNRRGANQQQRAGGIAGHTTVTDSGPLQMDSTGTGVLLTLEPKSSDAARDLIESLRVMSVAEHDTKLRRYQQKGTERKTNSLEMLLVHALGNKSRFRHHRSVRKGGEIRDADFDNFDYKGPNRETMVIMMMNSINNSFYNKSNNINSNYNFSSNNSSATPANLVSASTIPTLAPPGLEVTVGKLTLKSSKKDTTRKSGNNAGVASSISRRHTSGSVNGGISVGGGSASVGGGTGGGQQPQQNRFTDEESSNQHIRQQISHNTMTSEDFDPFANYGSDEESAIVSSNNNSQHQQRQPQQVSRKKKTTNSSRLVQFDTTVEGDDHMLSSLPSQRQQQQNAVANNFTNQVVRVIVNIALNEDLTCSYVQSQLSFCNVEGFIQVSLKPNSSNSRLSSSILEQQRSAPPFWLYIHDPLKQIDVISENKKIVQDLTNSASFQEEDDEIFSDHRSIDGGQPQPRYKFQVHVPKFDSYVAIIKYKCISDLRPVPIRVQTKVKTEGGMCRVALQISSNPNNSASLTDLTIVMGVPDDKVDGESLATQPPGGVWDETKTSVIWCVSELGSGEKFQLQARFDILDSALDSSNNLLSNSELSFPVLVRCQCLLAQFSSVEVEVRDIPETYPLDITTKLARRYRLSHREKNV